MIVLQSQTAGLYGEYEFFSLSGGAVDFIVVLVH